MSAIRKAVEYICAVVVIFCAIAVLVLLNLLVWNVLDAEFVAICLLRSLFALITAMVVIGVLRKN